MIASEKSVDWLGTARARLGVQASPNLQAYLTGGLAYGGVSANSRAAQSWGPGLTPTSVLATTAVADGHYSNTQLGWTIGAGVEWMFAPNIGLKAEYLYYDLGAGHFSANPLTTTVLAYSNVVQVNSSARFDGHILRLGLNYYFGADDNAPTADGRVFKSAPAERPSHVAPVWNGAYAGLNAGYAWGLNSMAANSAAVGTTTLDTTLPANFATVSAAESAVLRMRRPMVSWAAARSAIIGK